MSTYESKFEEALHELTSELDEDLTREMLNDVRDAQAVCKTIVTPLEGRSLGVTGLALGFVLGFFEERATKRGEAGFATAIDIGRRLAAAKNQDFERSQQDETTRRHRRRH